METHCERLERVYHAAGTNRLTPASMTISEGATRLEMPSCEDYLQAVGELHGMLYFKVLDETSFYAANSLVDDVFLTTASMHVQFLAALEHGPLFARAEVVHAGRSSFVVDATAADHEGNVLARSTGTFVRTRRQLPERR